MAQDIHSDHKNACSCSCSPLHSPVIFVPVAKPWSRRRLPQALRQQLIGQKVVKASCFCDSL
jgi:hypothetical protein